jgi:hypothetical protein
MSLFDAAREAVQLVQQIDNIELYRRILDLQSEGLKVFEENQQLKEQIKSLQEALKTKENLEFENNSYYVRDDGGKKDGPFCTHCWDKEQQLVRMVKDGSTWFCITHRWASRQARSVSG